MSSSYYKFFDYLYDLRNAPPGTKRIWLVIFTAFAMLIIFTLWFLYLQFASPYQPVSQAHVPASQTSLSEPAQTKSSFFETLSKGFHAIFQAGGEGLSTPPQSAFKFLSNLLSQFQGTRDFEFKN